MTDSAFYEVSLCSLRGPLTSLVLLYIGAYKNNIKHFLCCTFSDLRFSAPLYNDNEQLLLSDLYTTKDVTETFAGQPFETHRDTEMEWKDWMSSLVHCFAT